MKLTVAELRQVANILFDHLERSGYSEIEVDADFYWSVPPVRSFTPYEEPTGLTMGQLSDDHRELTYILTGARPPLAYALVWLAALLRFVGTRVAA